MGFQYPVMFFFLQSIDKYGYANMKQPGLFCLRADQGKRFWPTTI